MHASKCSSVLARHVTATVALAALVLYVAPASAADDDLRTAKQAASSKGYRLLESISADFNADGKTDVVGACSKNRAIFLCSFRTDEGGAVLDKTSKASGGNRLKALSSKNLVPEVGAPLVLLEVYGENPDEKTKRIRIYSLRDGIREVFTSVIFRPKNKRDRADWETDPAVIKYDDPRAGWYFDDLDDNGRQEVIVRRKPQIISLAREDQSPKRVITGVREVVYDWAGSPSKGKFAPLGKERLNNFIKPRKVVEVTASSAFIERKLEKTLKQDALSAAAMAAANGEAIPSKEIDRTPFIITGADDNLDTAWVENEKGQGEGEWIELKLESKAPVRMVRVVSGCVVDKRAFRRHNVPVKFELNFGRERAFVDRETPKRPVPPILGILELPIRGKKFAKQTLVFFDGAIKADSVRLTLQDARRLGRGNRTCISEISVH